MEKFLAPFSYEAIPFAKAIAENSTITFEWLRWSEIERKFRGGEIEAVLCPLMHIFDFQDVFVIPGVGISFAGDIPSPKLFSQKPIHEIQEVFIEPLFEHWSKWIKFIFKMLYKKDIIVKITSIESSESVESVLDDFDFATQRGIGSLSQYNLWELWSGITDFPLVSWVWLCRGDGDYRKVRNTLGVLWHRACELLELYQSGSSIHDETLDLERANLESLRNVYYRLASLESESLHWLLSTFKEMGWVDSQVDIHFC